MHPYINYCRHLFDLQERCSVRGAEEYSSPSGQTALQWGVETASRSLYPPPPPHKPMSSSFMTTAYIAQIHLHAGCCGISDSFAALNLLVSVRHTTWRTPIQEVRLHHYTEHTSGGAVVVRTICRCVANTCAAYRRLSEHHTINTFKVNSSIPEKQLCVCVRARAWERESERETGGGGFFSFPLVLWTTETETPN
jgi:hypothetical protein